LGYRSRWPILDQVASGRRSRFGHLCENTGNTLHQIQQATADEISVAMLKTLFSKPVTARAAWMLGLGALVLGGVASGQARRPDATLDELVVEVQALRAEMNQAAAASIRAQLLVGRLQMEDQRIAGVVRELEAVQAELVANAQARTDAAGKLKTLEEAVLGATNDVREEAEKQLAAAKAAALQADRRQQALKRRESGLAKELQEDQARWQQINARLENFEQAIPAGR
jgi:pyruvoyl-dependent arginine decarboxylase (PvlArgDC)